MLYWLREGWYNNYNYTELHLVVGKSHLRAWISKDIEEEALQKFL